MVREPSLKDVTRFLEPYNTDAADAARWNTPQIMGEPYLRVFYLPGVSLALKLLIHLVHHPQSRGPDRMTEALQSAIGLAGHLTIEVIKARHDIFLSAASG